MEASWRDMAGKDEPTECVVSLEQLKNGSSYRKRLFKKRFHGIGGEMAKIVKEAELGMCGQQERNGSCGR